MTALQPPIILTIKSLETATLLKEILGHVGVLTMARLHVDVAELYELLDTLGVAVPNSKPRGVKH